jgi:Fibronectin type III domain
MRRQNAERLRSRCVRLLRATGLTLGGVLLIVASSRAGVLNASWTAPTTHTDGSALTNLALYRLYYSTSDSACPGSTFFQVPPSGQTVSFQLTGLTTGAIYSISVTAVDSQGNESACSDTASAVARDDSAVTPSVQDATTPTIQAGSASTPTLQEGSATTPKSFCPPGRAKKGRC